MRHIIPVLFFFITLNVFSQENTIKHIVAKGESIYKIAEKYNVKQADIFKLNPKAKKKLKLNSVLLIPKPETILDKKVLTINHEVLPKETLYGISKQYKVSIDDIKKANPIIEKEGLPIGLKLIIAVGKNYKPEKVVVSEPSKLPKIIEPEKKQTAISEEEEITHLVLAKETKYGISRKYGITISELEKLNPEIIRDLPIGFHLFIKKGIKKEVIIAEIPVIKEAKESIEVKKEEIKPQIEEEFEEEVEEKTKETSQIKILEIIPHKEEVVVEAKPLSTEGMTKAELLIAKASENIGVRYRSGGTSKSGFDCSGLMINTFSTYDIKLPRSSSEMARFGSHVSASEAQKGDLIFFATMGKHYVSHVGMVVDVQGDEIKFIHSSTSAGVIISSNKEPYYAKRFVKVNRVLE
ncbi:peptidoglycan endopeptidase [Flavobacterium psychrophilum]|uniref:peptidoglycan endopeptidase n=1 Tax=Flavobacterium psychrophilum TaxID=96345 RepID=UPI000B7C4D00|nr:peptidoglycan endopeptidase [Flavobacterium psychrophilum]MCB5971281.1 NlpC/P60 family protein [Flavobacterium psychrophilum]MCB5977421.1 NlpC/P60 family protein [Flavobacterium psychrophilum]MCB6063364.1 NlpC/P60 family protein [Flavobacterium psychrophilum]MCB6065179.1 NlpC/P60 family protein [Flavobacterium psychrophilum]MCB6088303.1 NlpC/P60 family protein [Flavobacterium psychrophilum]